MRYNLLSQNNQSSDNWWDLINLVPNEFRGMFFLGTGFAFFVWVINKIGKFVNDKEKDADETLPHVAQNVDYVQSVEIIRLQREILDLTKEISQIHSALQLYKSEQSPKNGTEKSANNSDGT